MYNVLEAMAKRSEDKGLEKGRYLQKKDDAEMMKQQGLSDEMIITCLKLTPEEADAFLNSAGSDSQLLS